MCNMQQGVYAIVISTLFYFLQLNWNSVSMNERRQLIAFLFGGIANNFVSYPITCLTFGEIILAEVGIQVHSQLYKVDGIFVLP